VPYDPDGREQNTEEFLNAIESFLARKGTCTLTSFAVQRVKLFRRGVLNRLAHYYPVTLAAGEVEAAIQAVRSLSYSKDGADAVGMINQFLSKPTLASEEVIEAACWLRTAFDVSIRTLLKRLRVKIRYREDWSKLRSAELWKAAVEAMTARNAAAAAALIRDIKQHRGVFLDDWRYGPVSRLTKADMDAAWAALQAPGIPARTRLATFP